MKMSMNYLCAIFFSLKLGTGMKHMQHFHTKTSRDITWTFTYMQPVCYFDIMTKFLSVTNDK